MVQCKHYVMSCFMYSRMATCTSFRLCPYDPLRMFSWTVKRPFQVRTAWSFMDKGVKISTSTFVSVTKGPPESLFRMQIKFPGSPCRALWAPRKRRQRCHQVIRLSGWMFCQPFISVWKICVGQVQSAATCGNSKSQQNTSRTSM